MIVASCCLTLMVFQRSRVLPPAEALHVADTVPVGTAALPSAGVTPDSTGPRVLGVRQEELWSRATPEEAFAPFVDWTRRYAAAPTREARAAMEAEGARLARARLAALAVEMQTRPERAMELGVPFSVRQKLPAAVQALLEQPVNARGSLEVLGFTPEPGTEKTIVPVLRYAEIDGARHQVFTYGDGLGFVTRTDIPLNGIRVPAEAAPTAPAANGLAAAPFLMVMGPSPARLLDAAEVEYWKQAHAQQAGPVCSVSGKASTANHEETAVQLGGDIHFFCGTGHAESWASAAVAAAQLGGGQFRPASSEVAAYDTYTTGRKRFLVMRPRFADATDTLTDAQAPGHFNSFSNFMFEMSWGKLVFAGLGQGSDVTPIMLLPGNASAYDNTGLGKLYETCKAVAQTNYGYNLAQYDFFYVVTGAKPAASYAGLGFVRGVGFHLANGYYGAGTASHEYGHNLGLNHANFWSTLGKTIIGAGNSVEYGDGNDPMGGGGGSPQHYGSRYKNYLTWVPDSDVAAVSVVNSGTYRLYALDQSEVPGGYRGLRITRSGSQNYWVQFRRRFSGKSLQNGVELLWTGNGNQSSLLLDTRLKDSSGDNGVAIGRTFSDTSLGIHITPVGKAHTYPESMDVTVNVGSFLGNQPPTCLVSAMTTSAGIGQVFTFNAAATDPNGDPLAYFWEFGDADYSVDNSASVTHSFASAGEYLVQCTVSDMKGGTARDSILVRVGSPATFRISGRVLRLDQRPLAGIKVSADASHAAFTDSDGTYNITGLGAGNYSLGALETVSASPTFIHPFFSNPVTVGPSAINMDFIVGTSAPPVTLMPTGAIWKYLDNGTDQGTAWRAPGFVDTAWLSGPAQLGYGEGDEATVISYGPNASAKYTTTYFRRAFSVANAAVLTNATVSLLRDDGGIVYLNGVEIFRSNMPAGAVTAATFASGAIDDQVFFSGPIANGVLVTGNNVLAVEIHQADLTTSDASFDLRLDAENLGSQPAALMVYLSSPESGTPFTSPTNLMLAAIAQTTVGSFTNVQFYDGATKLGESASAPYNFIWNGVPDGTHSVTVRARSASGSLVISAPVVITVTPPSNVPPPVALPLVPIGSTWSYLAGPGAAPGNWAARAFNDTAWPSGPAELGFGDGGEATVIDGGPAANRYATVYFRRTFTIADPGAVTNLILQLKRDDGAVVYLNGSEVLRDNMPLGAVVYSTLATNAADDGATFFQFTLNPGSLLVGTNLLAVEVHQSALTSSDISFDLGLSALASTNRPRGVYLVAPVEGATVPLPANVLLAAQVVAGETLGVNKVEYFADGVKIGENSNPPFSFTWNNLPPGPHELMAMATDSALASFQSEPVHITVTPPPVGTALVSFGMMWKYQDNGLDLGTSWTGRTFDDRMWPAGPARLGYGGDGELTTVSYGTDPNSRHITTYFRRAFMVANPAAFSGLLLRLARDDGAVVYLNGVEVLRDNLLPGLVSWNSLALTTINPPGETTPIDVNLSPATLVAGTNVLAVEVHQVAANSSDLGFDLALVGQVATNTTQGIYLAGPAKGAQYNSPANIALTAFAAAPSPVTLVEYFDGPTKIGQGLVSPFTSIWTGASIGAHALTARATYGGGLQMTSPPVTIAVGYTPSPVLPIFDTLIPASSSWKYWDNVTAVGAGWQGTNFNDAAWPAALARFGYGLDGEVTQLTQGRITVYFRRWINVVNPFALSEMIFRLQRDDGAVVYLNGVEVYRSNMPGGVVTAATLASTTVNPPEETQFFETVIPAGLLNLMTGSNLVAVEMHQSSASSSDAGFDLQVVGAGTTEPRVYFSAPGDGSTYTLNSTVQFDGNAFAGTGYTVSKIELFADAIKLGETSVPPFHFTWPMPGPGAHVMIARMTDNRGAPFDSAPLLINVVRQGFTNNLIASNSVWKYLDNGSNQGTNWAQPGFSDADWASGPARLGYGGDGEATTISYGPNASAKYITTYFRKSFVVPPGGGGVYTNLLFKMALDDGAVVYLNGRELYRTNMPAGPILYTTVADAGTADEQIFTPTNVPVANLPTGPNLIAVEVHQSGPTSSDLGFNLEVTGSGYLDDTSVPVVSAVLADGMVEISWPSTYTSWHLYTSIDVSLPISQWTLSSAMPIIVGGRIVVTLLPGQETQFFRLGRP